MTLIEKVCNFSFAGRECLLNFIGKNMKVAMIRVPTIVDESASTAPICPPIGLSYLKSIVNAFTKDIQVIDSVGNKPEFRTVESEGRYYHLLGQKSEEIVNLLLSDTDIILISVMFSQDWPYSKEVIRGIKKKCPKSLIVAGGEHITALPKYSLESAPEIDICVLGEGEKLSITYWIILKIIKLSQKIYLAHIVI